MGLPVEDRAWRLAGFLCVGEGAGKKTSRQVVLPRRQRDCDLTSGALVKLGWTSCARTAAPGATRERDRQQPQPGQTVEMEGYGSAVHPERVSHFVATDRRPVSTHVVIDAPPGRLIQAGHGSDGLWLHGSRHLLVRPAYRSILTHLTLPSIVNESCS